MNQFDKNAEVEALHDEVMLASQDKEAADHERDMYREWYEVMRDKYHAERDHRQACQKENDELNRIIDRQHGVIANRKAEHAHLRDQIHALNMELAVVQSAWEATERGKRNHANYVDVLDDKLNESDAELRRLDAVLHARGPIEQPQIQAWQQDTGRHDTIPGYRTLNDWLWSKLQEATK